MITVTLVYEGHTLTFRFPDTGETDEEIVDSVLQNMDVFVDRD